MIPFRRLVPGLISYSSLQWLCRYETPYLQCNRVTASQLLLNTFQNIKTYPDSKRKYLSDMFDRHCSATLMCVTDSRVWWGQAITWFVWKTMSKCRSNRRLSSYRDFSGHGVSHPLFPCSITSYSMTQNISYYVCCLRHINGMLWEQKKTLQHNINCKRQRDNLGGRANPSCLLGSLESPIHLTCFCFFSKGDKGGRAQLTLHSHVWTEVKGRQL